MIYKVNFDKENERNNQKFEIIMISMSEQTIF